MAVANHMNQMDHGLYASIPIKCKSEECPYADSCRLVEQGLAPYGETCPVEASTIEQLVQRYCEEMEVEPGNMVDISLIRDLVDIDVSIARCNRKLAVTPDIVQDVVVAVTEDGHPVMQPEIHKAYELQNKYLRQRREILRLLNATRKDKAETEQDTAIDPSSMVVEMKKRIEDLEDQEENVINIEEEVEVEEEVDD